MLSKSASKITMLEIIEAVDGPMMSQLNLEEHAKGKFSAKAEKAYEQGLNAARAVYQKISLANLLG